MVFKGVLYPASRTKNGRFEMVGIPTNYGDNLQREWNIPARQTRFHKEGIFFMPITMWPGALADDSGYVVFQTEEQLKVCPGVEYRGEGTPNVRVGVPGGISTLQDYIPKG
jgi:hypothetical protein